MERNIEGEKKGEGKEVKEGRNDGEAVGIPRDKGKE